MNDVTRAIAAIEQGYSHAADQLWPLVYDELRKLAAHRLAQERPGQTLQATALMNEAYLRLIGSEVDCRWDSRGHFFAAAAEAMRRILVENARSKAREKRGGGRGRVYVDLDELGESESPDELLALHEALQLFERHDPLKAKLVELKFFGGMTLEKAAAYLDISQSTADRSWRYARAWLYAAMAGTDSEENESALTCSGLPRRMEN